MAGGAAGSAGRFAGARLRQETLRWRALAAKYDRDAARPTDCCQRWAANPSKAINAMWVAAETRRQGAARMLLDACLEWARDRHFRSVALNVKAKNAPARAAYAAAGFTLVRESGDENVLERDLSSETPQTPIEPAALPSMNMTRSPGGDVRTGPHRT